MRQLPGELSGGMLQRVMIAMALAGGPSLLIADEPTTALDTTIQAQVLQLLHSLQTELGMAILLITHDMGIAAQFADRVAVMYAGRVVEQSDTGRLFRAPQHPYTAALLRSVTSLDSDRGTPLPVIDGAPPSPFAPPSGCRFHPRCPLATDRCRTAVPRCATSTADPLPAGTPSRSSPCRRSGRSPRAGRRGRRRRSSRCGRSRGPTPGPGSPCTPSTVSASSSAAGRRSAW
ncbi:hypothetical protein GCM10027610_035430 [Dactylosporangium cerinum]